MVDRYENHLSQSEYRNRTLVQNSAPIVITTPEGIIRDLTPSAEQLFESDREALLNTPLNRLWPEKHQAKYQSLLEVRSSQTTEYHDIDITTSHKHSRPVDVRACRIEYGTQDAIYFLIRDVTENRRAREEMLAANQRLKDLDQLKTDFINTVSHELRTPLTSMRWSTESLSQLVDQRDETVAKLLRIIREDNYRLANMIEELLGFARLDAGKLQPNITNADLAQILDRAREEIFPLAQQKNITLAQIEGPETLMIQADAEQIRRIAINILDNAIKYTPKNGLVSVSLKQTKENAIIQVTDTGIGISENDQAHIFDKFYRTNQADVQNERGTGLGLAIVKGITEAHGGTVVVNSQVGRGTLFQVTLPRNR